MDMYLMDSVKPSGLMENGLSDIEGEDLFECVGETSNGICNQLELDLDCSTGEEYFDNLLLNNDPMISESAEFPRVKDEHSYCSSSSSNSSNPSTMDTLDYIKKEPNSDSDEELDVTSTVSSGSELLQAQNSQPTYVFRASPNSKQLLFSSTSVKSDLGNGVVNIDMPPTPPSDDCGDSSTSSSPGSTTSTLSVKHQTSTQNLRQTPLQRQQAIRHQHHHIQASPYGVNQPLFVSPIPTSGVLVLTEEEKRTLISEGYPIPSKLPLSKQEEKNLKKIRRKIKNKISAQESRRKKKEYVESLEKRMEAFVQENNDLRRKMEQLENHNRSLLVKVQSLLSKGAATHTAGTCVMVLVLCFAVFLGSFSSVNTVWGVGYGKEVPKSLSGSPISSLSAAAGGGGLGINWGYEFSEKHLHYCLASSPFGVGGRGRLLMSSKDESLDESFDDDSTASHVINYKELFLKIFNAQAHLTDGSQTSSKTSVIMAASNVTHSVPN